MKDTKIERKPDFSNYKNKIYGWEYIKTITWGNHRWNYFKLLPFKKDPFGLLKLYFDPAEVTSKRKKLLDKFKVLQQKMWLPIDKLYIQAQWGEINSDAETLNKENFNLSLKIEREAFFKKNVFQAQDFVVWVLLVMDWEEIRTIDDICNKFWYLFPKFISFSSTDMTPEMVKKRYNELLNTIKDHNIQPIEEINIKEYYEFVTNPLVSSISTSIALDKLFFFVSESLFLKGLVANFKPSFAQFTKFLDAIYSGKYNNGRYMDASSFRKLKENEIRIYDDQKNISYIRDDFYIPDSIKKKFGLIDWGQKEHKSEIVTPYELEGYKKIMKKHVNLNRIEKIDKQLQEAKKKYNSPTLEGISNPKKSFKDLNTKEEIREHLRNILRKEKKI